MSGVQSMSDDELLALVGGVDTSGQRTGGMRVLTGPKVKEREAPSGYKWTADGNLEAIPGGPGAGRPGGDRKAEADLRKEFNLLPEVKSFKTVRGAYGQIKALSSAISDDPDVGAQNDIAMIFSYMKMLDPDSVVREGEFATAQNATGVPDRILNMYNKAINGDRLNPDQRGQMVASAETIFKQQSKTYNNIANEYRGYAQDYDIEPNRVAKLAQADATETLAEIPAAAQARLKGWVEAHTGRPIDKEQFLKFANGVLAEEGTEQRIDAAKIDPFLESVASGKPVGGFDPGKREMTEYEKWMNPLAQSDIGAFLIGGGQTVTGNFLDELSGNPNANAAIDQIQSENPIASMLGQVSGGAAGAFIPGGAVATAGRAAATGAGIGAFSGLGAGEGGFTDRLDDAAIGALIGAGGGYAGQKLFDRFSGGIKPPSESAVRYKNAVDAGISEPTLGQTRGGIFSTIEKGLEVAPGGSGIVSRAANKSRDEAATAADNVAARFGEGGDFVSRGQALQKGGDKWIDKFYKTAKSAYDNVPISKDAKGSLSNVRGVLDGLQSKFESNPRLNDAFKSSKVGIFIDALGKKGSKISFGDLKELRTRLSQDINFQRFGDDATNAELKAIRKGLTEDMKATAMAQGPDALRKFNRANDMFAAGEKRIEDALTAIVGDRKMPAAEAAAALIDRISKGNKGTSNIKMLADIRKSMPKEEWGEVSSSIIRLAGQPLNSEGRDFSAKTFTDTFRDMAPEAKNLIFGTGEHRKALEEFADVAKGMAQTEMSGNPSGTAKIANVLLGIGNLSTLGAQAVAANGIARAWTNPAFVRWATGYTKMMKGAAKAGGQPNNAKQMQLLKKLATTEPSIAAEVMGLHDMFSEEE